MSAAAKDAYWLGLGLAAPARRGLVAAKLFKLTDLRRVSEAELKAIHGMGPTAIKVIKAAMKQERLGFRA